MRTGVIHLDPCAIAGGARALCWGKNAPDSSRKVIWGTDPVDGGLERPGLVYVVREAAVLAMPGACRGEED